MSWIDSLLEQTNELESPRNFWLWSGLCAISAVVKDNIWLNRGGAYNLYPNIYVILHAESGLKKGPPISLAKDLVKEVNNTKIISGRSSIQGILKKLGEAQTAPGKPPIMKSVGFICSSELSSSIVEDNAALTILTDLYDRHYNKDEWESLLKMENFQLKSPTVSLLGGINDAHAEVFFGKKDIQGGFLARTFVIFEKEEQTINSLMRRLTHPPDRQKLASHLKELSKLQGQFVDTFDENNNLTPVGKYYDEWYHDFRTRVKRAGVKDETGTINRFGDSVLKVAMLLALSRGPTLELQIRDMESAIEISEKLIGNIRKTTMGAGAKSNASPLKVMIVKEFLEREDFKISRVMLMEKMYLHYADATEFDGIMQAFEQQGLIISRSINNHVIFQMVPEKAKQIKEWMEGKNK